MARYLVTGGCGFIGSHLGEKLLELGHDVTVLDNLTTGHIDNLPKQATFIEGDIRDLDLLKNLLNTVDGCFHLAALASVQLCDADWVNAHHINLSGTINIFDAARRRDYNKTPIPVVYASSAAVYGHLNTLPLTENTAQPISAYGLDKLCCEYYARLATMIHGVSTVGLRLFNVYGPKQNPDSTYTGVITNFMNCLIENKPMTIYGDGKQSRDFIYVGDVVDFFILSMKRPFNHHTVYNVCTGKSATIKEIGDTLAKLKNVKPIYIYEDAKKGDICHSLGNPKLAFSELSLKATTSLETGLQKLVIYQEKVQNAYSID